MDDLVHDCFVQVCRRWPSRAPEVPVERWITGIARNVAFSFRRSEARRHQRRREVPDPPPAPLPDEVFAEREALAAIRAFTNLLSPKLRETFLLTDVVGVGVAQVARALGLPTPTVQSRRRLARAQFRKHFADRSQADRRALRVSAARTGTSDATRRRKDLAAIAVSAGEGSKLLVGATASAAKWVAGVVAVSAVAMGAARLSLPPARSPHRVHAVVAPSVPVPEPTSTVAATNVAAKTGLPTPRAAVPESAPPTPEPPSKRQRTPPRTPAASEDSLLGDLALLEQAKRTLSAGDAAAAVDMLEDHRLSTSKLRLEHQRLLLKASCAAADSTSAHSAAQSLQEMGSTVDPAAPCSNGDEKQ